MIRKMHQDHAFHAYKAFSSVSSQGKTLSQLLCSQLIPDLGLKLNRAVSLGPGLANVEISFLEAVEAAGNRDWHFMAIDPSAYACDHIEDEFISRGWGSQLELFDDVAQKVLKKPDDEPPCQLVFAIHVLPFIDGVERVLEVAWQILEPGGYLVVALNPDDEVHSLQKESFAYFFGREMLCGNMAANILNGLEPATMEHHTVEAALDTACFDELDETPDLVRDYLVQADLSRLGLIDEERIFKKIMALPRSPQNPNHIVHKNDVFILRKSLQS